MRSNPGIGGMVDVIKQVLPIALSLYGARAISGKLAGRIPGFDRIPSQFQGPAMAALLMFGAQFATKKVSFLAKHRFGILAGTGINLIDSVLSAFAPASVKSMFGLGDTYDDGLSDYVQVGATPIDDNLTLSDYVEVGDYIQTDGLGQIEEELGLSEELGVEEELGDSLSRAYLGGVSQSSMLRQVPTRPMLAAVPQRSFTRDVPEAGSNYDNSNRLYGGVFAGGF